ncbi:FMN-dependent NADPH-azoreductase-like isoform X2 [Bradysia coprophila]|nr:FMN-dependent NADPH-azoreductase-like isoform X2 [Bradysia coprophila]
MTLKIVIFLGSTRNNRMVDRVCAYVKTIVERKGMCPIIMDPAKMPFEIVKAPLHFYPNPADAPQWLRDTNDAIKEADGFLMLSPEYNYTLSPALTNMIDHFPPSSYRHKPAAVVTYSMGNFGGIVSSIAILPFMVALGLVHIPSGVTIPTVQNSFNENGETTDEGIVRRVDKLVDELKWYAEALNDKRAVCAPPS